MTAGQVWGFREEEATVLQAQRGDQEALEELLRRYESLVKARSAVYYLAGAEREDMDQVGRLAVLEAIRCWKPGTGHFASMVDLVVRRRVFQAVKMALRVKHRFLNDAEPFWLPCEDAESEWRENASMPVVERDAPCREVLERDALRRWKEGFRAFLSDREAQVARMLAEGVAYTEIAATLGITYKSVDNARTRVNRRRAQIWSYVEGDDDEHA